MPQGAAIKIVGGEATGQTAAVANIASTTATGNNWYEVDVYITPTVTGVSTSVNVQVTYTDENSTAHTKNIPLSNDAGAYVAAVLNTGATQLTGVICLRAKVSTAITVLTAGTFTGTTYNVGALIKAYV